MFSVPKSVYELADQMLLAWLPYIRMHAAMQIRRWQAATRDVTYTAHMYYEVRDSRSRSSLKALLLTGGSGIGLSVRGSTTEQLLYRAIMTEQPCCFLSFHRYD